MANTKMRSIRTASKGTVPLQAADILAYEVRKNVRLELGIDTGRDTRYPFRTLAKDCHDWRFYQEEQALAGRTAFLDRLFSS